jgi:predicted nucleic acid-binding protein
MNPRNFSRGESQIKPSDAIHLATMDEAGITSIISEDKELDKVKGINRIWIEKIHKPPRRRH